MSDHILLPKPIQVTKDDEAGGRIARVFLAVVLVESVLGGAGRFITFGPVTLKMVLFAVALITSLVTIVYRQRVERSVLIWVLGFVSVTLIGALIGTLNGAMLSTVLEDLSPLLSFLALPYFFITIRNKSDVLFVSRIIKISCILLGSIAITIFGVLITGYVPFQMAYALTSSSSEIFWRGNSYSFFYKGFIYLAVGLGFFISQRGSSKYISIGILVTVALMSATRGLLLAMAAVAVVHTTIVRRNWLLVSVQAVVFVSAIVIFSGDYSTVTGNRDESDAARVLQAREVSEAMTPLSLITGHGFGNGIDSRPIRMELTYFEILHKQGIIGLIFWACVGMSVVQHYRRASATVNGSEAAPYLLAVVVVYVQSLTNPFLNNPIGINIVIISMASLRVLALDAAVRRTAESVLTVGVRHNRHASRRGRRR